MVRLILYNIQYCGGTTKSIFQYLDLYHLFRSKKNLDDKMIEFLKSYNPDILALIEIDGGGRRSKKRNEPEYFAKKLHLPNIVHAIKYHLTGVFKKFPVMRFQENAVLAKKPLHDVKYHLLKNGTKKLVIQAELDLNKPVTLLVVHLALFKKTRLKQFNELIELINKIKGPIILMGDFNTFKEEELQILLKHTNLIDAYSQKPPKDIKFTEPSWKPKYRLDNVLVSPQIKIDNYEIIDAHFSDHLPVLVDFSLKF